MSSSGSNVHFRQVVVVSKSWTVPINAFCKAYFFRHQQEGIEAGDDPGEGGPPQEVGPYFVFQNFAEAAVYGRLRVAVHVLKSPDERPAKLAEIVAQQFEVRGNPKVVVVCSTLASCQKAREALERSAEPCKVFLVTEFAEGGSVPAKATLDQWLLETSPAAGLAGRIRRRVLVTTDGKKVEPLGLTRSDCLIHYDLPEKSRHHFYDRFVHLTKTFRGLYSSGAADDPGPPPGGGDSCCHMMLTPEDGMALKFVFYWLRALKSDTEELRQLFLACERKNASLKLESAVCRRVKLLGSCQVRAAIHGDDIYKT